MARLRLEWAFYGRRIRVVVTIALLFLAAIAFEVGERYFRTRS
jgi:hypothetical protein